jgi:hypothetical protein
MLQCTHTQSGATARTLAKSPVREPAIDRAPSLLSPTLFFSVNATLNNKIIDYLKHFVSRVSWKWFTKQKILEWSLFNHILQSTSNWHCLLYLCFHPLVMKEK